MSDDSAEIWLIEEGARVIESAATAGYASLSVRERLVRCLWTADYGMRNAGDLTTAGDLYPGFLDDGRAAARILELPLTTGAFSLSTAEFKRRYFALFDGMVDEVRGL